MAVKPQILPISEESRRLLRLLASDQVQRVLSQLQASPEGMTAAALEERTHIAQAALSRVLGRLGDAGIVQGQRSSATGSAGRPPTVWQLQESPAYAIFQAVERMRMK